jgi:hypothetical protein
MHKPTLQKITLAVITSAVIGFGGFAVHQLRIDAQAQGIVRFNTQLVSEFQENTTALANELLAVKVNYIAPLSLGQKQFLNKIQSQSKQLAGAIANTKTQQGINIPSRNNQEIMNQKLANLTRINNSLAEISYLHICLNQQMLKSNAVQKRLDKLFNDYAVGTTYADSQQILMSIDRSYGEMHQNLDSAIACFGEQLQKSTLSSSLQEVISDEQKAIKNYRQQYLEPLLQFYSQGNYLGAMEFQNKNVEAGQIRLIFPNLFKVQKHDLDIFRASYSSYVESEISNLILEAIASW